MTHTSENNCHYCGLVTSCTVDDIPVCSSCEIEHIGGQTWEEWQNEVNNLACKSCEGSGEFSDGSKACPACNGTGNKSGVSNHV